MMAMATSEGAGQPEGARPAAERVEAVRVGIPATEAKEARTAEARVAARVAAVPEEVLRAAVVTVVVATAEDRAVATAEQRVAVEREVEREVAVVAEVVVAKVVVARAVELTAAGEAPVGPRSGSLAGRMAVAAVAEEKEAVMAAEARAAAAMEAATGEVEEVDPSEAVAGVAA